MPVLGRACGPCGHVAVSRLADMTANVTGRVAGIVVNMRGTLEVRCAIRAGVPVLRGVAHPCFDIIVRLHVAALEGRCSLFAAGAAVIIDCPGGAGRGALEVGIGCIFLIIGMGQHIAILEGRCSLFAAGAAVIIGRLGGAGRSALEVGFGRYFLIVVMRGLVPFFIATRALMPMAAVIA